MLVAMKEVSEAGSQLPDLIRQVEAGNEVVLTRNGSHVARLIPAISPAIRAQRRAALERFQRAASSKMTPGLDAAHSQDFLYDEDGLPA